MKLIPPCSYQGAKVRIASQIVDIFTKYNSTKINFFDFCCGSGAISLELINRGFCKTKLTMIDAGPWGLFWKTIGSGDFNIPIWNKKIDEIPTNPSLISEYIKKLSKKDANIDTQYDYLILQAASFGSKAIWKDGSSWKNCSFRNYWQPTASSNRKSPVNPMMPMPESLRKRVIDLTTLKGLTGKYEDVINIDCKDSIVYIDPPYENLTKYGHTIRLKEVINNCVKNNCIVFVSEAQPLENANDVVEISTNRSKGGISGNRTEKNPEYISIFRK